jgi:hypothetical protein
MNPIILPNTYIYNTILLSDQTYVVLGRKHTAIRYQFWWFDQNNNLLETLKVENDVQTSIAWFDAPELPTTTHYPTVAYSSSTGIHVQRFGKLSHTFNFGQHLRKVSLHYGVPNTTQILMFCRDPDLNRTGLMLHDYLQIHPLQIINRKIFERKRFLSQSCFLVGAYPTPQGTNFYFVRPEHGVEVVNGDEYAWHFQFTLSHSTFGNRDFLSALKPTNKRLVELAKYECFHREHYCLSINPFKLPDLHIIRWIPPRIPIGWDACSPTYIPLQQSTIIHDVNFPKPPVITIQVPYPSSTTLNTKFHFLADGSLLVVWDHNGPHVALFAPDFTTLIHWWCLDTGVAQKPTDYVHVHSLKEFTTQFIISTNKCLISFPKRFAPLPNTLHQSIA